MTSAGQACCFLLGALGLCENNPNNPPTTAPDVASVFSTSSRLLDGGNRLPLFSSDLAQQTYEECDDLRADLMTAALYVATNTISCEADRYFHNNWGSCGSYYSGGPFPIRGIGILDDIQMVDSVAEGPPNPVNSGDGDNVDTSEDSFGTNNQVEGVDEADFIKSNGKLAFATYGREIVVYDVETQAVVARQDLPDPSDKEKETPDSNGFCRNGGSVRGLLLIQGEDTDDDNTEEEEDRLLVFTQDWSYYCGVNQSAYVSPIVSSNAAVNVFVYGTNSNSNLDLLSTTQIIGNYVAARSIQNNAYLVTSQFLDLNTFTWALSPYNQEVFGTDRIKDEETYRTLAEAEAEANVGTFVDSLVEELECTSMQTIALLQNTDDALTFSRIMDSLVSVHAFAVNTTSAAIAEEEPLSLHTHTMVLPTSYWHVFASSKYLALAGQGYHLTVVASEDGENQTSVDERTHVIVFELDGPSTGKVSTGSVPGYALNQFSMDHVTQFDTLTQIDKEYMRIATCTNQRWWWWSTNWGSMEEGLCEVNVLEISNETSAMPLVGTVPDLGKEGERIYAVRFQGNRGFVVTFRETDPFYTLDLADPNNPMEVGELFIEGFSSYLHPIDDNFILGVGQEVIDGRRVGLKISLFDVTNFSDPQEIIKFVEDGSSHSGAEYDHRAFRYLSDSGLLILPLRVYGNYEEGGGFDGFSVYYVDTEEPKVEKYMEVEHASGNFYWGGCWSRWGWLNERSIVVTGRLYTFKSHSVVATFLSNRTWINTVNLDEDLIGEDCSRIYYSF